MEKGNAIILFERSVCQLRYTKYVADGVVEVTRSFYIRNKIAQLDKDGIAHNQWIMRILQVLWTHKR